MKRVVILSILVLFLICIAALSQTAVDPEDFTGPWYAVQDQGVYCFSGGLIYHGKPVEAVSDSDFIFGAYTYCKNSILLFTKGIDGLEKEKELYIVNKDQGSFLCENKDGTGTVYFIRYNK